MKCKLLIDDEDTGIKSYIDFTLDINSVQGHYYWNNHIVLIISGQEYPVLHYEELETKINLSISKRNNEVNFN